MTAGTSLPPEVVAALRDGDRIEAIRRLRESSGLGLRESLVALQGWESGGGTHDAAPGQGVLRALHQGDLVGAIRELRAGNPGMDLRTARQVADTLRREASMRTARNETHARTEQARAERTPTVVEGDHGGYAAVLLAVVAAVAALGWWFFGS